MNHSDVLDLHTGSYTMPDIIGGADSVLSGASRVTVGTGKASLGVLSLAIIGVMFFYVATRGRQF